MADVGSDRMRFNGVRILKISVSSNEGTKDKCNRGKQQVDVERALEASNGVNRAAIPPVPEHGVWN